MTNHHTKTTCKKFYSGLLVLEEHKSITIITRNREESWMWARKSRLAESSHPIHKPKAEKKDANNDIETLKPLPPRQWHTFPTRSTFLIFYKHLHQLGINIWANGKQSHSKHFTSESVLTPLSIISREEPTIDIYWRNIQRAIYKCKHNEVSQYCLLLL